MLFLDVKYCIGRKNTEIRLPRMRANYFGFLPQTNSALKITSAIRVPNLVKIGEKLRPLALTNEKNYHT